MSLQCSNPVYGTSCNPHSKEGNPRECGGSIIGLGSDIGGSLRASVAFCGGFSLKPTEDRHLTQQGVVAAAAVECLWASQSLEVGLRSRY